MLNNLISWADVRTSSEASVKDALAKGKSILAKRKIDLFDLGGLALDSTIAGVEAGTPSTVKNCFHKNLQALAEFEVMQRNVPLDKIEEMFNGLHGGNPIYWPLLQSWANERFGLGILPMDTKDALLALFLDKDKMPFIYNYLDFEYAWTQAVLKHEQIDRLVMHKFVPQDDMPEEAGEVAAQTDLISVWSADMVLALDYTSEHKGGVLSAQFPSGLILHTNASLFCPADATLAEIWVLTPGKFAGSVMQPCKTRIQVY